MEAHPLSSPRQLGADMGDMTLDCVIGAMLKTDAWASVSATNDSGNRMGKIKMALENLATHRDVPYLTVKEYIQLPKGER